MLNVARFEQVVSAIPLTAEQQADVAAAINGQLEAGQSAKITTAVDAELMGGMTVSIGDKYTEMKVTPKSNIFPLPVYSQWAGSRNLSITARSVWFNASQS